MEAFALLIGAPCWRREDPRQVWEDLAHEAQLVALDPSSC